MSWIVWPNADIVTAALGFSLLLLAPGLAMTFALWPKTKLAVYQEVLSALGEKNIKNACIIGKEEDAEEMRSFLNANSIDASVSRGVIDRDAVILIEKLRKGILIPADRTVIDLGDNRVSAVKIEDTVDWMERIAIGFGLGIAITPLIGIILSKTPYGIHASSFFLSMAAVILISLSVYYRRK